MIYSDSIYCNALKQSQPRPANWYSTLSLGMNSLIKFAWVKPAPIAFESSFKSAHTPLGLNWDHIDTQTNLEHNRYVLPFGTLSLKSENRLYWRNCAISYLITYNQALIQKNEFQALLDGLDSEEVMPEHWLSAVTDAQNQMLDAKLKFKACRKHEKSHFGIIKNSDLPASVNEELLAITRLRQTFMHAPHNWMLAADLLESFLDEGFGKLAHRHVIDQQSADDIRNMSYPQQLIILQCFIKERVVEAKHKRDETGAIISTQLVICGHVSMEYFLCFSSETYGSIKHLKGYLSLYGATRDVTKWFKKENLSQVA